MKKTEKGAPKKQAVFTTKETRMHTCGIPKPPSDENSHTSLHFRVFCHVTEGVLSCVAQKRLAKPEISKKIKQASKQKTNP